MRTEKERTKEIELAFIRKVKLVEKICPSCKRSFWGAKVKKYCSVSCANRANYERHAEARRADRRERYREEQAAQKKTQVSKKIV